MSEENPDIGVIAYVLLKGLDEQPESTEYTFGNPEHAKTDGAWLRGMALLAEKGLVRIEGSLKLTHSRPDYHEYIASPEWAKRSQEAKDRAGNRCQVCYQADEQLDTHHRTYERLGHERPEDLIVLCRGCHTLFHECRKLAR